jgi:hypothetical protein
MAAELRPVALQAPELVTSVVADGLRLGFHLRYVDGMAKQMRDARMWWFAPGRLWVMNRIDLGQAMAQLRSLAHGQHLDVEAAFPLLVAAVEAPSMDYFTQRLDVQVFPLAKGDLEHGRIAVSFSYDGPCVRVMQRLRARFHPHAKAWQVPTTSAALLRALQELAGIDPTFVFEHEQPVTLENLASPSQEKSLIAVPAMAPELPEAGDGEMDREGAGFMSAEVAESVCFEVDEAQLASIAERAGLRDYQLVGVRHLAGQSGACLGDDMGLGKSRQSVVAARLVAGAGRVLILCPASLRINWEREIHAVFPNEQVGLVGEDRHAMLANCQWVVANYERLGGLVRDLSLEFAVMVVDEAHYLKEYQAGRTRNAFLMAARIERRFVVTGTPLLSREVELHTLLRMTGHPLGSLSLKDFGKRFAGAKDKRAALADALRGWMLRRRKDVLSELGTKTRQVRQISPAQGLGLYQEIWNDMSLQMMPKIGKLRRALESLKASFLIETVEGLSEGDKIIIFCEYMATVETLKGAFAAMGVGCVSLVGSDSPGKRQKAIDAFQNDASVTVFIGTTMAAGVGITLTAANYVAFASLPWTPALMRQAEDRAYRLGQRRNVIVLVPLIERTIDDGIWALLTSKEETERDVVEAVRSALPGEVASLMKASELKALAMCEA